MGDSYPCICHVSSLLVLHPGTLTVLCTGDLDFYSPVVSYQAEVPGPRNDGLGLEAGEVPGDTGEDQGVLCGLLGSNVFCLEEIWTVSCLEDSGGHVTCVA